MKFFLVLITILFLNVQVKADGEHTPDICAVNHPDVCAHLGHMSEFSTQKNGQFVAHALFSEELENFRVSILYIDDCNWKETPATFIQTKLKTNKYLVQNIRFAKSGVNLVRITFTLKGVADYIDIPIQVLD